MQKLRREVEKAKRTLSFNKEALVEVENLVNFEDFEYTLTRARFEEIIMVCSKDFIPNIFSFLFDSIVLLIITC